MHSSEAVKSAFLPSLFRRRNSCRRVWDRLKAWRRRKSSPFEHQAPQPDRTVIADAEICQNFALLMYTTRSNFLRKGAASASHQISVPRRLSPAMCRTPNFRRPLRTAGSISRYPIPGPESIRRTRNGSSTSSSRSTPLSAAPPVTPAWAWLSPAATEAPSP